MKKETDYRQAYMDDWYSESFDGVRWYHVPLLLVMTGLAAVREVVERVRNRRHS